MTKHDMGTSIPEDKIMNADEKNALKEEKKELKKEEKKCEKKIEKQESKNNTNATDVAPSSNSTATPANSSSLVQETNLLQLDDLFVNKYSEIF